MFYDDPHVLYISIHRHDDETFFPGTGKSEEVRIILLFTTCLFHCAISCTRNYLVWNVINSSRNLATVVEGNWILVLAKIAETILKPLPSVTSLAQLQRFFFCRATKLHATSSVFFYRATKLLQCRTCVYTIPILSNEKKAMWSHLMFPGTNETAIPSQVVILESLYVSSSNH